MQMYTETELMQRSIRNARPKDEFHSPLWVIVKDIFAVGKTQAVVICKHYGFDPDEMRQNYAFYEDEEES